MSARQPLKQRIVFAFVLMTLLTSGAFSFGIVEIVHHVEERLVSKGMRSDLEIAVDALGTGRAVQLDKSEKLYTTAAKQLYPPAEFLSLKPGFSEVVAGEQAYYAFKLLRDDHTYVLTQDQREFEAREQLIYQAVLACFLVSLLIAWGLGALLANRVLQPVAQLANDVRSGARYRGSELLAKNYADDEVGRLAEAFDKTFAQLRRSLDREKLFTSDVSHELRTPLMVIGTSCELLSHSTGLTDKQMQQVARIRRASDEMLELVETLLLLAREKGSMTDSVSLVPLEDAAIEQDKFWGPQFAARGIDYRCTLEEADDNRYQAIFLRTVMSNLLRNALHYTEKGRVELQLFNGGFRVEDTGPGIAPEQQSRLFEPFQRGDHARGEGLGLGLSLVKRICEYQGWSVSVRQLQPQGCVFCVDLKAD
ncbi:HAMP domain-containing sensor histidine kinase [Microbulbifer bruguierae]|uniref:histidine kinase n=1 Tax=Microbulbifer bruguierae TaxID=3029061 RepID=A0ABY8NDV7_9GAMM|nr:HAMP domain-containing sensor histidine kinase [Microbulbifer bruguierae]WGL16900.1 HAMP domain-containing sensor histidine kinase [Microbulbifer bruguierae]